MCVFKSVCVHVGWVAENTKVHNRKECKCLVRGMGFKPVCVFVCVYRSRWLSVLKCARLHAGLTQDLADGGVVHVREGLQDPPALVLGPYHEGIHGSLDVARGRRGPGLSVAAWD